MNNRRVCFNDTIEIYLTYSSDEYPRNSIDSILYQKAYNRVSPDEWNSMWVKLDLYKIYEMVVHKDSLQNNKYHCKHISLK